jgi:hypothetical protein
MASILEPNCISLLNYELTLYKFEMNTGSFLRLEVSIMGKYAL